MLSWDLCVWTGSQKTVAEDLTQSGGTKHCPLLSWDMFPDPA